MDSAARFESPELDGLVLPFPRFPRRRIGLVEAPGGFRAAVLLADNRPSPHFPMSRTYASAWLASEAARDYSRRTGLPLWVERQGIDPDAGGPGLAA